MKNIIITTGGTGGHLIPALTIYENLVNLGHKVTLISSKNNINIKKIYNKKINIKYINIYNFRKLSFLHKIFFPINFIKSILESINIIKKIKPNLILGMGNYVSLSVCIAGWINKIPIIIHEQNSIVGLSNKILSYISNKCLSGFNLYKNNYIHVGNPIRNNIIKIPRPEVRLKNRIGPIRILILGGSQGSNFINYNIPNILNKINIPILIWHQIGNFNLNKIINYYYSFENKILYSINKFIYNIDNAYKWSDLIITRSGAMTISEIMYVGLPSIIIPLISKDNHQYYNALYLENIGVSKIFNEYSFNVKNIYKYIYSLNRKKLYKLSLICKKKYDYIPNNKILNEIINL